MNLPQKQSLNTSISIQDQRLETQGGNVLDCLERAGFSIPNNCRTGHCLACLAKLDSGELPKDAQRGLSAHQRRKNYFLACQFYPINDVEVSLLPKTKSWQATLIERETIHPQVLRVRLRSNVDWLAGQYITVWRSELEGRVFSIASSPEEGFIELHLKRRNGIISGWLENSLKIGDQFEIGTPQGDCYYSPAMPKQPLILIGMGTGLAPTYGILKQALTDPYHGDITLYAVSKTASQLYMMDELNALSKEYPELTVIPVAKRRFKNDQYDSILEGTITNLIAERHKKLKGHLIYLCGPPGKVERLKDLCFMQGAAMSDIFCDAF